VSVAEIAVAFAQPLFFTPRFTNTHSLRLTIPLLLPIESSIVAPFASIFEVPVIVKFWVTVPPPVGETGIGPGVAEAQLRFASAAEAV
jgi:hypothetical protein